MVSSWYQFLPYVQRLDKRFAINQTLGLDWFAVYACLFVTYQFQTSFNLFFVLARDFLDTSTAYYVKYKSVILKVSI